jgi:O-antigen ligase
VNLSAIQKMNDPATVDDYALPETVALEAEAGTPRASEPQAQVAPGGRKRGAEFYKPFHYLLLIYLFFYCSRIPEMIPAFHVGLLLQPLLLVGMIMTGTTKTIYQSSVGRAMIWFTGWMLLCIPFATWKGGAFDQFTIALQALLLIFFMTAFIRSIDDCYRVMFVIALAMTAVGILSLVIGGGREGSNRLGLGTGNDTLSDSNFLALFLIVGLPLIWFSASVKKGLLRVVMILAVIPVMAGAAETGSRSGLLALGAGIIFFLIFATMKQRIIIVGGGLIFFILAGALLPPNILGRFTTIFQAKSAGAEEAAESAETRKMLLGKSLDMTLHHPILGVGPGQFMVAEAREAMAAGHRGVWHYTHNSYTELSSECGIPGLIFYLAAFWRAYRGLTPIRNRYPRASTRRAAMFVQMAVLMAAIGAFFLSIAYGGILYAVLGVSAALQLAVGRERKESMQEQALVAAA